MFHIYRSVQNLSPSECKTLREQVLFLFGSLYVYPQDRHKLGNSLISVERLDELKPVVKSVTYVNWCFTDKMGFPGGSAGKESTCNAVDCLQCRRHGFDPCIRKIPQRRKWQPAPAFLPGKFHGQRSLVDYKSIGSQRVRHDSVTKPPPHKTIYLLNFNFLPGISRPYRNHFKGHWLVTRLFSVFSFLNISAMDIWVTSSVLWPSLLWSLIILFCLWNIMWE